MHSLADFLNHGTLPFAGRSAEIERIVSLWRNVLHGDGLRSLLVEGEAGIGKSRLIQEAIAIIEEQSGAVVHLKLYPESTVAIAPLAAQALWKSRSGRHLLRSEPEGTLPSVVDALHRFSRLRPTLLVIEDVHLLEGATLREFMQMIESIEDEPLALLCAARPMEHAARGVLERWPLEEMALEELSAGEIGMIWQKLFGQQASEDAVRALASSTLGNALAIRSALRGALRQEALVQGSDGRWIAENSFEHVVERNATSLTEGMMAHLTGGDRKAAGQLAALGEVFSQEAAEMLVDRPTLESLIFSGLLHDLTLPKPPLPALPKSSGSPLAFTHSLVHRQLVESTASRPESLIAVIAAGVPLYSVLPFELIVSGVKATSPALDPVPLELVRRAISSSRNVALALDTTSDWHYALDVYRAAEVLVDANAGRWDQEELHMLQVETLAWRLSLLRRQMYEPEFGQVLERLLALTGDQPAEPVASFRLLAYVALARRRYLTEGYAAGVSVRPQVIDLVERFPALKLHRQYIVALQCFAQLAEESADDATRRETEREYQSLIDSGELSDDLRQLAQAVVSPHFITLFETPRELERRLEMYRALKELASTSSPIAGLLRRSFVPAEAYFLRRVGWVDQLLTFVERELPGLRAQGMMSTYYSFRLFRLWCRLLLTEKPEDLGGEIDELASLHREIMQGSGSSFASDMQWTAEAALIRGDREWVEGLVRQYGIDAGSLPDAWQALLDPSMLDALDTSGHRDRLQRAILTPADLISLRAILMAMERKGDADASTCEPASAALAGAIDWLAERRLNVVIESWLNDFERHLAPKQVAAFRKSAGVIASEREAERSTERGDGRLVITMLGRIEVRASESAEPLQPRGARQKSFLGAMVACEMLARPLERDEFLEAAGIENDDPKLARDAVNSAIYRLRELLGRDAIVTPAAGTVQSGETPRLNFDLVQVDLVDAHRLLHEAVEAARQGALARAQGALLRTLEISRGEVPFPTLYESFFEAMREDFENLLRSTVIDVARLLLRESDGASAGTLLERAFAILPEDEEIAELYCRTLESLGRKAEAARVRRKVEAAA
jgi:DNA-binding SARP family transcriptional activator